MSSPAIAGQLRNYSIRECSPVSTRSLRSTKLDYYCAPEDPLSRQTSMQDLTKAIVVIITPQAGTVAPYENHVVILELFVRIAVARC